MQNVEKQRSFDSFKNLKKEMAKHQAMLRRKERYIRQGIDKWRAEQLARANQ